MKCCIPFVSFFSIICWFGCKNDTDKSNTSDQQVLEALALKLKQHPDNGKLRLQYINTLDSLGQPLLALKQLDSLITKDSLNYGLWYRRGEIAENVADTTIAIQSFEKAIAIYSSPEALLSLANLYAESKNPRSLFICDQVRDMRLGRETEANCNFIAGIYYVRTGNKEKAVQLLNVSIAQNYTHMEAYIEKGLIYFDVKDYTEALKVFNFAASVNNLYADAYYYQARCYEMMNKKDSAAIKFQQALGLDHTLQAAKDGLQRLNIQ